MFVIRKGKKEQCEVRARFHPWKIQAFFKNLFIATGRV